jgi:hypothetical protein
LIGEVAALLADYALACGQTPAAIYVDTERVRAFQRKLSAIGIPIGWDAGLIERLIHTATHSLEV